MKLYTVGSSWFSGEDGKKGSLAPGQLADLAVLSADYFSVPDEEIKRLESLLTLVGGKVVYAAGEFAKLSPPDLPVSPAWSPVAEYGGYAQVPGNQPSSGPIPRRTPTGHPGMCTVGRADIVRCRMDGDGGRWAAIALHSEPVEGPI